MKRDRIYLFKIDVLLLIAILLSVAGSVCNLILPLFVRQFIDVRATSLMSFDSLLPILTVLMMGSIVNAVSMYLISVSGDRRIRDIRENIEEKLLKLPISFYKENASGELVSRIINDSLIIKEFTTYLKKYMKDNKIIYIKNDSDLDIAVNKVKRFIEILRSDNK